MRRKILAAAVAVAMLGVLGAPSVLANDADEGSATATISSVGSRTLALPTITPYAGSLDVGGEASGGVYSVQVVETAVNGADPWTVSARLCGPNNPATPTASDCATYPEQLVRDDGTASIAGTEFTLNTDTAPLVVAGGGVTSAGTDDVAMDQLAGRELMRNDGQATQTVYTGTYTTGAGNAIVLDLDNLTETGTFVGYLVVSLVD